MAGGEPGHDAQQRAALRGKHQQLAVHEPGSDMYRQLADTILVDTGHLLASEAQTEQRRRAGRTRIIQALAGATAAELAAFTAIFAAAGWGSLWWLILLIAFIGAAAALAGRESRLPLGTQCGRVVAAAVLAATANLAAFTALRLLPGWMAVICVAAPALAWAFHAVSDTEVPDPVEGQMTGEGQW